MNIITELDNTILNEIKRLASTADIEWDKFTLNSSSIDFMDNELEVECYTYSPQQRYRFFYDYDSNIGHLLRVEKSGEHTVLWKKGSYFTP